MSHFLWETFHIPDVISQVMLNIFYIAIFVVYRSIYVYWIFIAYVIYRLVRDASNRLIPALTVVSYVAFMVALWFDFLDLLRHI